MAGQCNEDAVGDVTVSSLDDQPKMTLKEIESAGLPAFWLGEREEFMFDPQTGAILWRGWADIQSRGEPMHSWHGLPPGKAVPESGWIHWLEV